MIKDKKIPCTRRFWVKLEIPPHNHLLWGPYHFSFYTAEHSSGCTLQTVLCLLLHQHTATKSSRWVWTSCHNLKNIEHIVGFIYLSYFIIKMGICWGKRYTFAFAVTTRPEQLAFYKTQRLAVSKAVGTSGFKFIAINMQEIKCPIFIKKNTQW